MTVFFVTLDYPPLPTTTANLLEVIASEIARDGPVVVLSGSGPAKGDGAARRLDVVEIPHRPVPKGNLKRRFLSEIQFCFRAMIAVLRRVRRGDQVFTVTTPFALPYFVALACWVKRASLVLLLHDLYPDVLVATEIVQDNSLIARAIRCANRLLFKIAAVVVVIGQDIERRLSRYPQVTRDKLMLIPNWASVPPGVRPVEPDNPFRVLTHGRFVVGLSGNLGFTHDPDTVFAAAKRLVGRADIHFLLSGWGVGWDRLMALQDEQKLPNVTMVQRVDDDRLEEFLSAADVWLIPYRKNTSGVSVPSRLYNLLAIGRPVIALAEPDSDHARLLTQNNVGWTVPPEDASALAETICAAAANPAGIKDMAGRAVGIVTNHYTRGHAIAIYRELVRNLSTGASRS